MNYYEILEVSKTASNKEIKTAYKKLVKKYHPDIFDGNKAVAEEKIKLINEAYDILSNPDLRSSYDNSLDDTSKEFEYSNYTDTADSDISDSNNSTPKYEDLYKYDYYRKYSTNYYGVSHDRPKSPSQKDSKIDDDFIKIKSKTIVLIGVITIFILIALIFLLSSLKNSIVYNSHDVELSNQVQVDVPYVYYGMTFDEVKDVLNLPDRTEMNDDFGFTAYWGKSYIIFDRYDIAIDFHSEGDFSTNEAYNSKLKIFRQIYTNNVF